MKKIYVIAAIAAATLGASSTFAAATSAAANILDTQEIRDTSLSCSYAARKAFKAARGTYALDDGTMLSLYSSGNKIVAEVSGKEPFEVLAMKNGKFVAVNGSAKLKFVQDASGRIAHVVLTKGCGNC